MDGHTWCALPCGRFGSFSWSIFVLLERQRLLSLRNGHQTGVFSRSNEMSHFSPPGKYPRVFVVNNGPKFQLSRKTQSFGGCARAQAPDSVPREGRAVRRPPTSGTRVRSGSPGVPKARRVMWPAVCVGEDPFPRPRTSGSQIRFQTHAAARHRLRDTPAGIADLHVAGCGPRRAGGGSATWSAGVGPPACPHPSLACGTLRLYRHPRPVTLMKVPSR